MTMNPADYQVAINKREGGITDPECGSADNTTGCVLGPLSAGRWGLKALHAVYFKRGGSTITGAQVAVDEATPATSTPLDGGEVHEIIVEQGDTSYNYVAFRTASGTALVWAIPLGDFDRQ